MRRLLFIAARFFVVFSACILVNFLFITYIFVNKLYDDVTDVPHAESAIILGASITPDGKLSPVLQDRADMAIQLYKGKYVEYRARDIFLAKKTIIVTQSFHLSRAVFIARELGIDAYGMNADNGHYLFRNYIREIFADVKATLDLITKRSPRYLGETIPLTGDSRANN